MRSSPEEPQCCEMIFILVEFHGSGVFFVALLNTTAGDPMNKSGTLITSALLTFGIAAAAMAANSTKATAIMAADTTQAPGAPTIGPKEDQRAIDTAPPKSSSHKHKKKHKHHKPATPAPTTTK
jgi:hypothetical protein